MTNASRSVDLLLDRHVQAVEQAPEPNDLPCLQNPSHMIQILYLPYISPFV